MEEVKRHAFLESGLTANVNVKSRLFYLPNMKDHRAVFLGEKDLRRKTDQREQLRKQGKNLCGWKFHLSDWLPFVGPASETGSGERKLRANYPANGRYRSSKRNPGPHDLDLLPF
jgi:hypothetical protein